MALDRGWDHSAVDRVLRVPVRGQPAKYRVLLVLAYHRGIALPVSGSSVVEAA